MPNAPGDLYDYDRIYRLTDVKYGVPQSYISDIVNNSYTLPHNWDYYTSFERKVNYTMDGVGNRSQVTEVIDSNPPTETIYYPNSVNEYYRVSNTDYSYDHNGNLTYDGSRQMYYNYANRLAQVVKDGVTYSYRYDALGRRVTQMVGTAKTLFFYDGQQIILEQRPETSYNYIYGIGIDEPIVRYEGDTPIYYHANSLGSIIALTDSAGDIVESYEYDVYGAVTVYDAEGEQIPQTAVGNRYTFTGREMDWQTGLMLGSPERLRSPLIRKNGNLVETSWDEALEFVASKLSQIKKDYGADLIAFMSSAKCTNEENYIMQKFAAAGLPAPQSSTG